MAIDPQPPLADFALPWDDAGVADPVAALEGARERWGDTFAVRSGGVDYLFVFSPDDLGAFFALDERNASKGLADYRMLVRKLPTELFVGRRTFAHDLFGRDETEAYLVNLDWAIEQQLAEMGGAGTFDVFAFSRRIGHRLGLACWMGREAPVAELIADLDVLDGAEAFVHPDQMRDADHAPERAALARVESAVGSLLGAPRAPSFLDDIAARWEDTRDPDRSEGIARDVVLLHIATMTNLFAALGWTLAHVLLHPGDDELDLRAFESIRIAQRSIMLREVLRPITFAGYEVSRGTQLATMVPLTNAALGAYEPARWRNRELRRDVSITTFGHGSHRCPAQRFSIAAIVRTVQRLRDRFELTPTFATLQPLAEQIGGVARAAGACPVDYRTRRDA